MAILKREETANTRSAVPTAPSAEKAAISIILQNYEVLDAAKWDADLFFEHSNRALLSAAKECHNEGYKSDIFRLQAVLEEKGSIFDVGGYHGVTEAFTAYPTGDAVAALDFRKDLLKARRYRKAMAKLAESRDDIREMRADLNGIAQHLADSDEEQIGAASLKQQCNDLLTELLKTTPPERFTTGVNGLDESEGVIKFDGLDAAIVGVGEVHGQGLRLVYSADQIIRIFMEEGMTEEDAVYP